MNEMLQICQMSLFMKMQMILEMSHLVLIQNLCQRTIWTKRIIT